MFFICNIFSVYKLFLLRMSILLTEGLLISDVINDQYPLISDE